MFILGSLTRYVTSYTIECLFLFDSFFRVHVQNAYVLDYQLGRDGFRE